MVSSFGTQTKGVLLGVLKVQTPKQCRSFEDQNLDQTKTVTVRLDTAEN